MQKTQRRESLILLEGNIGSGKTAIGRALRDTGRFGFLEEPVEVWENELGGLLTKFYEDPKRWAFTLQLAAFTTRAITWDQLLRRSDRDKILMERSTNCDRWVFEALQHKLGNISKSEHKVYNKLWEFIHANWAAQPSLIVYVVARPETCLRRIVERGRAAESRIGIDYLRALEYEHDSWLLQHPKCVKVNNDIPSLFDVENKNHVNELASWIEQKLRDTQEGLNPHGRPTFP